MPTAAEALAGVLLAHACYTDLRSLRIRNWAVLLGAAGGLALHTLGGGWAGTAWALEGIAAGAIWWAAVYLCGLGAGDAKLAMALGAILGPGAALGGPACGCLLCALALGPWVLWRRSRGLPWRGVPLPMAPWLAAGVVLVLWWGAAAP